MGPELTMGPLRLRLRHTVGESSGLHLFACFNGDLLGLHLWFLRQHQQQYAILPPPVSVFSAFRFDSSFLKPESGFSLFRFGWIGCSVNINPTNGSSYTWTVLQSQQVASSRLRAIEQNRWVVQASPTGFSAFISPEGEVYQRTSVSEQEVITRTIELRGVRTWYSHTGDAPWVLLMALLLALSTWRSRPFPRFPRFSVTAVEPLPGAVNPDA